MRVPFHLLRETITYEEWTTPGARGPSYLAARTLRALMQPTRRLRTDDMGRVVAIDVVMIVRPEEGPLVDGSRITWDDVHYRIISSYPMPDSRRPTHYEAMLGRLED